MAFFNNFNKKFEKQSKILVLWYQNLVISEQLLTDMPTFLNYVQSEYNIYEEEEVRLAVCALNASKQRVLDIIEFKIKNKINDISYFSEFREKIQQELDRVIKMNPYSDDYLSIVYQLERLPISTQKKAKNDCLILTHHNYIMGSVLEDIAALISNKTITFSQIKKESTPEDVLMQINGIANLIVNSAAPTSFLSLDALDFDKMNYLKHSNRNYIDDDIRFFNNNCELKNKYIPWERQ